MELDKSVKKEIEYYISVSILRQIFKRGNINIDILEKINGLNAEKLGCQKVKLVG